MEVLLKYIFGITTGAALVLAFIFRRQSNEKQLQLQISIKKNLQNEQIIEQLKINYNELVAEHSATKQLLAEYQQISVNITNFQDIIEKMKEKEDERFGRLIRILNNKGIQLTKEELNDLTP